MNLHSLVPFLQELQTDATARKDSGGPANYPHLLEFRTESGPLYVCPSRWERIRLLWAFRHFHVLPPQVLSRRDQRLIERLSRSTLVRPSLPVASHRVFGVIEKPRTRATGSRAVVATHENLSAEQRAPGDLSSAISSESALLAPAVAKHVAAERAIGSVLFNRFRLGLAFPAALAVCIVLCLAWIYEVDSPASKAPGSTAAGLSGPKAQVATRVSPPASPSPGGTRGEERPRRRAAVVPPEPTLAIPQAELPASDLGLSITATNSPTAQVEPPATAPARASQRFFISALPQGHLVTPAVSDPNLVGELRLRAFISADGSVRDVSLMSGNPALAEAGIRAIRRWRYSPQQVSGSHTESETFIRMNFFGEDAVSITSAVP